MRSLILALTAATAASSLSAQGDVLYYRFDAASGNAAATTVNFVAGVGAAPSEATLSNGGASVVGGMSGSGLSATSPWWGATNSVDTGWIPSISGSFTVSMFVQNKYANDPLARATLFGEAGGFRGDVGATSQGGFVLSGWGGPDLEFDGGLPWCFVNGWTHMAIVLDTATSTATLYRGGAALATTPLPTTPVVSTQFPLVIGDDGTVTTPSLFDIDEVRVLTRAATAQEIQSWSVDSSAAAASFGDANGTGLQTVGGAPVRGNQSFGLEITGLAQTPGVLVFGWARVHQDLVPLLGPSAGILYPSLDAQVGVMLNTAGLASVAVPIPATLGSTEFFVQAFTLDGEIRSSNAIACGVGAASGS